MKKILLLLGIGWQLIACSTTLNSIDLHSYSEPFVLKLMQNEVPANDFCEFDNLLLTPLSHPFQIRSNKESNPLPIDLLGVITRSNVEIELSISPDLVAKQFQQQFIYLAQQSDLPEILQAQGKKLYIRIDEIPSDFYFIQKGHHRILYFDEPKTEEDKRMYDYFEREESKNDMADIMPAKRQLIVKYAFITEKKTTAESTVILYPFNNLTKRREKWKKAVPNYFRDYQLNLALEAKTLLDAIMNNTK